MFFKKGTSLMLAVFLLVSNLGLAINVHYCGKNIEAITLGFSSDDICEVASKEIEDGHCCGVTTSLDHKKCCSDDTVKSGVENVIIKQINLDSVYAAFYIPYFQEPNWETLPSVTVKQKFEYSCEANAPPLFKLYSQYIFYA